MEVCLVPVVWKPQDVLDKIQQLDKMAIQRVELTYTLGEMSYRSDMSALPFSILSSRLKINNKRHPYPPTSAGTGPTYGPCSLEVPMDVAFDLKCQQLRTR